MVSLQGIQLNGPLDVSSGGEPLYVVPWRASSGGPHVGFRVGFLEGVLLEGVPWRVLLEGSSEGGPLERIPC